MLDDLAGIAALERDDEHIDRVADPHRCVPGANGTVLLAESCARTDEVDLDVQVELHHRVPEPTGQHLVEMLPTHQPADAGRCLLQQAIRNAETSSGRLPLRRSDEVAISRQIGDIRVVRIDVVALPAEDRTTREGGAVVAGRALADLRQSGLL